MRTKWTPNSLRRLNQLITETHATIQRNPRLKAKLERVTPSQTALKHRIISSKSQLVDILSFYGEKIADAETDDERTLVVTASDKK